MGKKKIADFSQSFLLIVLFLLLLGQCAFYIRLAENLGNTRLEVFPERELALLGTQQNSEDTSYLITPCFTGVIPSDRIGGGCFLPLSRDGAGVEVWQFFIDILKNSIGGTAKQVIFSDTQEKESYLTQLYLQATECYYVKFSKGIEFSVLTMLLSDTYDMLPDNPDFVISDMFLVAGTNGEASIVAVDKYGEVLKIFPSKNISFNTEFVETYNNTNTDYFEFVRIFPSDCYDENGYFPILSKSLVLPALAKSELSSFVSLNGIGSDTDRILSVFGMNKDNTKSYITSDGDYMFVENATRLRIEKNGVIQYIPDVGGTHVHSILEYSGNTGGGIFGEMAMLSRNVASTVSDFLYLCDGKLSLYDISYNGTTLSFIYQYTANGIPVNDIGEENDTKNAVRLDFEGDRLMYASINIIPYRFSGTVSTNMPQLSALAIIQNQQHDISKKGVVEYFGAEYVFSEGNGAPSLVFVMKSEKEAAN